jgi:hypothetical protein
MDCPRGRAEGFAIGRAQGREAVLWIGRIQLLEKLLDLPVSSVDPLAALSFEERKAIYERLHSGHELRFKRS